MVVHSCQKTLFYFNMNTVSNLQIYKRNKDITIYNIIILSHKIYNNIIPTVSISMTVVRNVSATGVQGVKRDGKCRFHWSA